MNRSRSIWIALCASALATSCATPEKAAGAGAAAQEPAALAPAPDAGAGGAPGFDDSALAEPARRELRAVFSDEFCYCGCPHALGTCLQEHGGCRHAKRMAELAAMQAQGGAPSTEIIRTLSKYYASFRTRFPLTPDPRLCKGPSDAKVTLVEFSDFECPYCAYAAPVLDAFAKSRSDVRLCYVPFPLPGHPNAMPAAQAALLARDSGRFWEMHDALFANQRSLSRQRIVELGVGVGLSRARLQKVLDAAGYAEEVEKFQQLGRSVDLQATPTVYVNGRPLLLAIRAGELRHAVEDELEWAQHGRWGED